MDNSVVVVDLPPTPDDIIFQILSRTSLKTLGRCRLLSKEWYETTYDSHFTKHFFKRSKKVISGFFIQDLKQPHRYFSSFLPTEEEEEEEKKHKHNVDVDENTKLSLAFLPGPVKILAAATTQGILLCENYMMRCCDDHYYYYVCKPATKEWQTIPNPNTRYFTKAIAIMVFGSHPHDAALRYKIVRFSSEGNHPFVVKCEIFYSETWAWKRLKDIRLPDDAFLLSKPPAVSVRGKLYWLISKKRIFVFDLKTESWEIFAVPKAAYENEYYYDEIQLVEYQGRLGLIFMENQECIQLWVLLRNKKNHHHHHCHHQPYHYHVWGKRREINIEAVNQVEPGASPVGFCNADVLVLKGFFRIIFYKFQNINNHPKISKLVRLDFPFTDHARQVFFLQSDFEPTKLRN